MPTVGVLYFGLFNSFKYSPLPPYLPPPIFQQLSVHILHILWYATLLCYVFLTKLCLFSYERTSKKPSSAIHRVPGPTNPGWPCDTQGFSSSDLCPSLRPWNWGQNKEARSKEPRRLGKHPAWGAIFGGEASRKTRADGLHHCLRAALRIPASSLLIFYWKF
jgi:hypothetical protein